VHHLHYHVALKDGHVALTELMGLLVAAVSAVLHAPSPQHVHMVKVLVSDWAAGTLERGSQKGDDTAFHAGATRLLFWGLHGV
jgi:hypothetical protein